MKVEIEAQVIDFVRSLASEPRRTLRDALRKLAKEDGDIRALEGDLEGFYRLRVMRYRVIFFYERQGRSQRIRCVYAAHRNLIYEVFAEQFRDLLE